MPRQSKFATKRYVKDLLKEELEIKYNESGAAGARPSYDNPVITALCVPAALGDDAQDMVGREVRGISLKFQAYISNDFSAFAHVVRIVLFQWFDDATPTGPDILQHKGDALSANSVLYGNYNQYNEPQRMRVIYDRKFLLGGDTQAEDGGSVPHRYTVTKNISFTKNRLRKTLYFDDVAAPLENNIWICAISDQTDASGSEPSISYTGLFRFTDG